MLPQVFKFHPHFLETTNKASNQVGNSRDKGLKKQLVEGGIRDKR